MPKLTATLSGPLKQMQVWSNHMRLILFVHLKDSARRIAKVSAEAKLPVEEEEYVQSFRPHLMDVVNLWTQGAPFSQICKMTEVFEGSIIRCIRRLEELMRQMCEAAKAIGNVELEQKFADGKYTATCTIILYYEHISILYTYLLYLLTCRYCENQEGHCVCC